jgi:hypothetical protein
MKIRFGKYHQFIIKKSQSSAVMILFYKQVDRFYSDTSILHYMSSYIKKKGKLTKKDIAELITICKKLFIIDEDRAQKLYDSINIDIFTAAANLLYGIEIKVKLDSNGSIDIEFDNVDKYQSIKTILFYFTVILSDIANTNAKDHIKENAKDTHIPVNKILSKQQEPISQR